MHESDSGWIRFWNRGTWWKALLFVAVYWGVYELIGLGIGTLFGGFINLKNPLADPLTAFLMLALPILIAGILLFLFARSLGWVKEIFGPQPLRGQAWMWVAIPLLIIPIFLRLVATNWSAYSVGLVLVMAFFGLCVGFTEELATRGIVVNMLRNGGYGERLVFVLSCAYFALLHSGNILTMEPLVVAVTVVYTFGFGAMMYLSMRVTGSITWAILLHAATDPTTFLATGGIDGATESAGAAGLISLAGIFNWVYILLALLAIFFVKGHATRKKLGSPTSIDVA
ncbi:CPBP family intramembrane glutamic endopeptidase [Arthrobacter sp. 18067]|uniref:CPBP family intramembrane glutamic endopeptidase n=1 Tax=Arthrobacter sp. 18067 TaxID=2681413 RepID=UPI0013585708|nr:CPBP family intramembrane glutamic endopeptidase [Arthrobacter sp. 18067]